ncbi:MAG: TauD/TfdA family dioxygenase [Gammaproteobacteria bacterium]
MEQSTEATTPKLGTVRRKPLSAAAANSVQMTMLPGCGELPLVITPQAPGMRLVDWAAAHRQMIEDKVLQHGAVLFRTFDLNSIEEFEQGVIAISGGILEYRFRASPRTQVGPHVYTATDYPAAQSIFPHNEHSYSPICPLHLYFYCERPAETGGETPLGDGRCITRAIDERVRERFIRKKIRYVRNYGFGFGLPWQTAFQTTDKSEVECYCWEAGIEVEWKPGDRLCTRQIGPAVVKHPRTGEAIWFNHATFFHITTLPQAISDVLLAEFDEAELPQNTYYGDGSRIELSVLEHLREVYQQATVVFPWQCGDVLLVDNVLTVHARQPFTGQRRVLVAMAEAFRSLDLDIAGSM